MNKKRCIYAYEFKDNSVYVGLTCNIKNRMNKHKKEKVSSVYKHMEICSDFTIKILSDYLPVNEAKIKEGEFVEKYKNEKWKILNRTGTGSIGSNILYWTYERCKETALKYKTRTELKSDYMGCYIRINREKWSELFEHMINGKIKWTKEKVLDDSLKYDNYYEYRTKSKSYAVSVKYKMTNIIVENLNGLKQKQKGYWTFERCEKEALKYNFRSDFKINCSSAYSIALKNNWLNNICHHMKEIIKPKNYWTFEKCKEEASKYSSLKDFEKNSSGCYSKCVSENWLTNVLIHINYKKRKTPNFNWTKEECKEKALNYKNRYDFNKHSGAYKIASKNGWLDEICSHMK
jgi:predicted GIY-YIG superfamily endonuclease